MTDLFDFDENQDEVYVLDTETTGLKGAPADVVVDIGVCRVNLRKGTVDDAYSEVVGDDVDHWNEYRRNAWIFENTDMTLDMVKNGRPFPTVRKEIYRLLEGKNVTSYNIGYDMDKFLYKSGWDLKGSFNECCDIMKAASRVCRLPGFVQGEYRWPKLDYAYSTILGGDDPAGIHGKQDHRALSDARVASHIMIRMYRDGQYRL